MDTYAKAEPENQSRLFTESNSQSKSKSGSFVGFTDNRLSAIAQRRQIDLMNSPAFPEEAGSIAPMGASAIRGNVLQQYSDKGSALNGGMCLQMKAFKDFPAGNALGLADDAVAFFGKEYNHYQKNVGAVADEGAAFKAIATQGGQVGKAVDGLLHEQAVVKNNNYYQDAKATVPLCYCWNLPEKIWNQQKNKINITKDIKNNIKINPFVVTTKANYQGKNLMTTSMYDHEHYSYVVKVENDGNGMRGVMEGLFKEQKDDYKKYGQTHVKNGKNKILEAIEEDIEPYTKLAGEGARFMCVRNHMDNLRDDTIFYTRKRIGNNGQYFGITFNQLWHNWDNLFNKKFNIDNKTIIDVLLKQQFNNTIDNTIDINRDYYLNKQTPKEHAKKNVKLF